MPTLPRALPLALVAALAPFGAAHAVAVAAQITGCGATSCDVAPLGGPVAVDPDGFTLEVDWTPEHVELVEPDLDRGEWRLRLFFDVTISGGNNGVDHFGAIQLTEMHGAPIVDVNVQFDDVTQITPVMHVNYDLFGPDQMETFFAHGFDLAQSSFEPDSPGVVTAMAWTGATFTVSQGGIDRGVWVPEPASLALTALGVAGLGWRRRAGARRR